jgi:hypothetical protein
MAAARGYAEALARYDAGAPLARATGPGASVVLADLFERAAMDAASRAELDELTEAGPPRRLRRGEAGPDRHVLCEAPPEVRAALEAALARYAADLIAPVEPGELRVLDVAREHGIGVASWPRVRFLLLVEGATEGAGDDVILEIKELPEGAQAVEAARRAWATPDADPRWARMELLGFATQVRAESAAHRTIRVRSLEKELGKPEALVELARQLGGLLARLHAVDAGAVRAIAPTLAADLEGFVAEQADAGLAYADLTEADHDTLRAALKRLGPTLGIPAAAEGDPVRQALFAGPCPR